MKKYIVLLSFLLVTSLSAQVITNPMVADSSGLASRYWQTCDLRFGGNKVVTLTNRSTGTDTLYFAINASDTSGAYPHTSTPVFAGQSFEITTTQQLFYVKTTAFSSSVPYSITNGRRAAISSKITATISGSVAVNGSTLDSILTVLNRLKNDTIYARQRPTDTTNVKITAPYWKSFVATDSITRVRDALAYSANDIMTNDSTAAKGKFFAFQCGAQNGGRFIITDIQVSGDTLESGGYMLVGVRDSATANHIADNAPYVMLGNQFSNRVGEIIGSLQTTGGGSGSNNAWDYQTGVNLQGGCAAGTTYIYFRWIWTAAYTPAFAGTYRIKIKGLQEVLPQ